MKKIFFGLMLLFCAGVVPGYSQSKGQAEISFANMKHEFGTIPFGVPATYVFTFKNTGKAPLVVSTATASCGCTTPVWTKEAIQPGGTGTVKATFNAGTPGVFDKTVTVVSNAKTPQVVLSIHGTVKPQPQPTAAQPAPAAPVKADKPKSN